MIVGKSRAFVSITIWKLIALPFLVYLMMTVVPIILAIRVSVTELEMGDRVWRGFDRFTRLVNDGRFWTSFKNNAVIVGYQVLGQVGVAYVVTLMLASRFAKARNVHRFVLFVPVVLSAVVVGFLWSIVYDQRQGLLNAALSFLLRTEVSRPWLANGDTVLFFVSVPIMWQYVGLYVAIFMASYASIPREIFEMCEIEGIGEIRKAIQITAPLMWNTFRVSVLLCVAGNMKIFDHIFVMTGGGPGTASSVLAMYAYEVAFDMYRTDYATAISLGILILSGAIVAVTQILMRRSEGHA